MHDDRAERLLDEFEEVACTEQHESFGIDAAYDRLRREVLALMVRGLNAEATPGGRGVG